jgi:hypothetical protein
VHQAIDNLNDLDPLTRSGVEEKGARAAWPFRGRLLSGDERLDGKKHCQRNHAGKRKARSHRRPHVKDADRRVYSAGDQVHHTPTWVSAMGVRRLRLSSNLTDAGSKVLRQGASDG